MASDIQTLTDVKLLVDSFYEKVRGDAVLGKVFNDAIGDRWPAHLEKMYAFWQTILLEEHTYYGSPFMPHAKLPIGEKHFDRWLALFDQTVDEYFSGDKAYEAKWRADRMALMFKIKIAALRGGDHPVV